MTNLGRLLMVEDEPDLVAVLLPGLERAGYAVSVAHDGEEGLAKARKEKPDLILLDVMMPKMNGYQVCRELKQNSETKKIPVIMLTARSQESDRFWGKETGAEEYLIKPYDTTQLLEKIAGLLVQHRK